MKTHLYATLSLLSLVFLSACGGGSGEVPVIDNSFNIGTGMNSGVLSVATATNNSGDIYVGGDFTSVNGLTHNRLVRMNSDGTVDSGFNIGTGMNDRVYNINPAIDGSGDVYVGGNFTAVNGVTHNRLVRMNSDGTVDNGFNIGTGMNNYIRIITPATDGSGDVYVGGNFTTVNGVSHNYLVRLNSDGTVDSGFNIGTGMNGWVTSIVSATDNSGDIYVGGLFNTVNGVTHNYLVRLNSDGTVDSGFNIGTGLNDWVYSIALAADNSGDIYVGGLFTTINGVTHNRLVRMNSDGTVDSVYNIGTGINDNVVSLAPVADNSGDVYVGGYFNSVNGVTHNRLVRMNSDGTVDNGFNIGTGMNSWVNSIALASDGSNDVYVGGGFTTVNAISSNYLVGMNPDGTVE